LTQQVKVGILGREYILHTTADKAYVEKVAQYVSLKCQETQKGLRGTSQANVLALTALNIASEYFQIKESYEVLLDRIEQKQRALAALLP